MFTAENLIALLTLTFLEIVLGIDNIIFISIVTNRFAGSEQKKVRLIGIAGALVFRIILLLAITWIIGFTKPLFQISGFAASGRDLILFAGGLFLLAKSTSEIHHKMAGEIALETAKPKGSVAGAIIQIILLDIIFSFDSILTAIGLSNELPIMIAAIVIALAIMTAFAGVVSSFIGKYPTLQILALSFLILIGFMLAIEALHFHVPKGYIYFAVFFSLAVEYVNIKVAKRKASHNKSATGKIN
ncbi:MAG: TerC family protein [Chloroflexota bacterium]